MDHEQEKEAYSVERLLIEEIVHILKRNQNEKFLRKLLTRAIILEKIMK